VGIGTANPTEALTVSTKARFGTYYNFDYDQNANNLGWYWNAYFDESAVNYKYISTGAWGGTAARLVGTGSGLRYDQASGGIDPISWNNRLFIDSSGNLGISTTTPAYKLAVVGTGYFSNQLTLGANLNLGANSISMSGGNIGNVGKLTVTSIDPLYEIGGEKYATYVSDTIGYKVESFGKGKLVKSEIRNPKSETNSNVQNPKQTGLEFSASNLEFAEPLYSYIIDFSKVERGSNLWLFWQTISEGQNMEDVSVVLTPEGDEASLWYVLNPASRQIIIRGDKDVVFSYHLVAPRHDAASWPNVSDSQYEGTVLPEK